MPLSEAGSRQAREPSRVEWLVGWLVWSTGGVGRGGGWWMRRGEKGVEGKGRRRSLGQCLVVAPYVVYIYFIGLLSISFNARPSFCFVYVA